MNIVRSLPRLATLFAKIINLFCILSVTPHSFLKVCCGNLGMKWGGIIGGNVLSEIYTINICYLIILEI